MDQTLDVAVIGAGAAGLAAAIFTPRRNPALFVDALDGAKKPGAKILVSGGGRCNVTNSERTVLDAFLAGTQRLGVRFLADHHMIALTRNGEDCSRLDTSQGLFAARRRAGPLARAPPRWRSFRSSSRAICMRRFPASPTTSNSRCATRGRRPPPSGARCSGLTSG